MTTFTIDWLSYTVPWEIRRGPAGAYKDDLAKAALVEKGTTWRLEKPRFGYSEACSPSSYPGPVVYFWQPGEQSHTHVQWSGQALSSHGQAEQLLLRMPGISARVTRLDLAVDIAAGDPLDVWTAHNRGELLTTLRKRAMVTSDTGITVYLGSRSSERFIRVYDKAGQMGLPGPWVRVELELKGDAAHGIAQYINQEGVKVIPGTIKHVLDCPTLPWYKQAFQDDQAVWGAPKVGVVPDRAAWIQKQVTPALIDMIVKEPGQGIATYRELCRRVGQATGVWPLEFDGHTVDRYNEIASEPDEV